MNMADECAWCFRPHLDFGLFVAAVSIRLATCFAYRCQLEQGWRLRTNTERTAAPASRFTAMEPRIRVWDVTNLRCNNQWYHMTILLCILIRRADLRGFQHCSPLEPACCVRHREQPLWCELLCDRKPNCVVCLLFGRMLFVWFCLAVAMHVCEWPGSNMQAWEQLRLAQQRAPNTTHVSLQ